MRLGILQCDSVLPEFSANFPNYPEMFQNLLYDEEEDPEFVIYDVQAGEYPADIDECDAYVTTGSRASVYEEQAWIKGLSDFLLQLHHHKKKLVGICFGHQLIAQALHGKTEPAAQGWGIGVKVAPVLSKKPWMEPPLEAFNILASHKDQVTLLPPGAEQIAGSDFCPNSAYTVGNHILCFQGHPEFSKEYAETLMRHRAAQYDEAMLAEGLISFQLPVHDKEIAQWIWHFIKQ